MVVDNSSLRTKVFISWSGKSSHATALLLRDWLPTVIYNVDPWVSSEDIKKGSRWSTDLAHELDACSLGIICVDTTSVNSSWLNFEAGALSKSVNDGCVFPLLFGISSDDLNGPLSQFQVTNFHEQDVCSLVIEINRIVGNPTCDEHIRKLIGYSWLSLSKKVEHIFSVSHYQQEESLSSKRSAPSATQNSNLSSAEENILLFIAKYTDDFLGKHCRRATISSTLKVSNNKVSYYLGLLEKKKYICYFIEFGYVMSDQGTAYLIERDMF